MVRVRFLIGDQIDGGGVEGQCLAALLCPSGSGNTSYRLILTTVAACRPFSLLEHPSPYGSSSFIHSPLQLQLISQL